MGLFKIWKMPIDKQATRAGENALRAFAEGSPTLLKQAMQDLTKRVAHRFVKAEGIPMGRTWEHGNVRIHRYRGSFRITDLTNAGKRGKKVRELAVGYRLLSDDDPKYDNLAKLLPHAGSYDEILRLFKDLKSDDEGKDIWFQEVTLRGIDVNPGGTTKIHLTTNQGLEITAEPQEFLVKRTVEHKSPSGGSGFKQDTLYYSKSKKDAAPFYNWLKANLSEANKMGILELSALWDDLGVRYDFH